MEFLIIFIGLVVAQYFVFKFITNKIESETLRTETSLNSETARVFKVLAEKYKMADAVEVSNKISFLENLIEKGFNQSRDRLDKIEEKLK